MSESMPEITSRKDLTAIGRLMENPTWNVSEDVRDHIVACIDDLMSSSESDRTRLAAARLLVRMLELNVAAASIPGD